MAGPVLQQYKRYIRPIEINVYFDIYKPYSQEDYITRQWCSDVISATNETGYKVNYGYRSVWESIPVDTLKNHIIEGHPVIVTVGSGFRAERFVVVEGFDDTRDVFYLHDPDDYVFAASKIQTRDMTL